METIKLSNGVLVEVQDKTSVLSGDLFMVHLEITTVVELDENDTELRSYCPSGKLRMTRILKKSAVHERDLREVRRSMEESFLNTNKPYMEHPKFIGRFKHTCLTTYRDQEVKAGQAVIREE
ncbi:MAG TPA: hypothetical protein VMU10_12365 [Desulfomonilia bacterium]|nr:hypothetical protein [Desulfomonilia bacterium]